MKRKHIYKAIIALAVAMAFVMPVAAFANFGTIGIIPNIKDTSNMKPIVEFTTNSNNIDDRVLVHTDPNTKFGGIGAPPVFPPAGWAIDDLGAETGDTWKSTSAVSHTGEYSAYVSYNVCDQDEWLITPEITLPSGSPSMEFYHHWKFSGWDSVDNNLKISTDDGSTWTILDSWFDPGGYVWFYETYDLSTYAGMDVKLAWQYVSNNGEYWYIDDIDIAGVIVEGFEEPPPPPPPPKTVYVDDDADPDWYNETQVKTITEGITNASAGDTVYVYNGMYYEHVIVDKQLNLVGQSRDVIVDGSGSEKVVYVTVNEVSIDTFTITNGDYGIYIYKASNTNIINCDSYNNADHGIYLGSSSNCNIMNCTFYSNSQRGIYLYYSSNNNIINCNIYDNTEYGVYLIQNSDNNLIRHNNFVNNVENAYDVCSNQWDDGSEGNYWSDYTGVDGDCNGIGDSPYLIPGGSNQDNYPLMMMLDHTPPEITDVLATPPTQISGGYVNITATVTDNVAVDTVKVNITYPDSSTVNVAMNEGSHYYNTTYTEIGTYDYFIWADDTSGNEITSDTYHFEIMRRPHDVGVISIDSPISGPAGVFTPEVTVENFGSNNEASIPVSIQITKEGSSVAEYYASVSIDIDSGETKSIILPDWTPDDWQIAENVDIKYTVEAITQLITDQNPGNDHKSEEVTLHYSFNHDAGLDSIISPIDGPAGVFTPEVTVTNYGSNNEMNIPVNMQITKMGAIGIEYDKTVYIDIDSEETKTVTFPEWTPDDFPTFDYSINYEVTACTQLSNDGNPGNDCKAETITLVYLHDVGLVSIDSPIDGPADSNIAIEITVGNFGTYDEVDVPMVLQITKEGSSVAEYYASVSIDIDSGETKSIILPDWTPDDWQIAENVDIDYTVEAITQLITDQNPGNDHKSEDVTLHYGFIHDVGVTIIDSPVNGPPGVFIPEVTVENFVDKDETDVPVNLQIGKIIDTAWTEIVYDGTGHWEQRDYEEGYGPSGGTPLYFAQASHYDHPGDIFDVGLFTPPLGLLGLSSVTLEFESRFNTKGNDWAEVNVYSGGTELTNYEETLVTHTTPTWPGIHETFTFDPSGYDNPSEVYIEFYYTTDGSDSGYYFAIDDVSITATGLSEGFEGSTFPPGELIVISEYDETVYVDIDSLGTASAVFPDWTPVEYTLGNIKYDAYACTQLSNDGNPENNCETKTITIGYLHDVGVTIIGSPVDGNGGVITPEATVENFGTYDEVDVLVNIQIGKINAFLLHEDFSDSEFPPTGWTQEEANEWIHYNANMAGGESPEARLWWPYINGDYAYLQSPAVDTTASTTLMLEFKSHIDDYIGGYNCRVLIRPDDAHLWTDITPWSNPITGNVGIKEDTIANTHNVDVSSFIGTGTEVRFEFDGSYWRFNSWYLDDISLFDVIPEGYDETITIDISRGDTKTVVFPDWIATDSGSIDYAVIACTELLSDEDTGNDCTGKTITLEHIHDVGVKEITDPSFPGGTGIPGAYPVRSIFRDYGSYPESNFIVRAEIFEETTGELFWGDTYFVLATISTGDEIPVDFDYVTFGDEDEGDYRLEVTTELVGDENSANNQETLLFTIESPEIPDETPPVTTHEFVPSVPNGENSWYVSDVTVTFTATDATSGVDVTKYSVDGGSWQTGDSVTVTADGEHIVEYYSIDNAGNEETTKTVDFKIDQTPPVTTHEFVPSVPNGENSWYVSDVTVTLTATDATSGVDVTKYRVDGGSWQTGDSVTVTTDGEHTVEYYSIDNAGNEEDINSVDFKIDQTVPTIALTWDENDSKLVADVDDETSGVAKVEFYVNDECVGEDTTAPYEWTVSDPDEGDTATAIVYDNAGNSKESAEVTPQSHSQSQSSSLTPVPIRRILSRLFSLW